MALACERTQPSSPAGMPDLRERGGTDDCNPLLLSLSGREIPSLNGLRGAAALAVVVYHYLIEWKGIAYFPGFYAVDLFFELSGFLITWLLLKEIHDTGRMDARRFYLRRALRLFPVFYVVWILCRMAGPFPGSWATFFYMGDYYHALTQRYNILTSAWSLGVEEKFYLLWPFILARIKQRKLVKILVGLLILEPVYRSLLCVLGHRPYTWFAFDTRLDAIVIGCLLAIFAARGWRPPEWIQHPLTPICALVLVFALQAQGELVTYLLAVILLSTICRPAWLLNNPVARYLGAISYSLYLCHVYAREVLWPRMLGTMVSNHLTVQFTLQLALAIILASALHFVVEKPFLSLKDRLRKKSAATAAGSAHADKQAAASHTAPELSLLGVAATEPRAGNLSRLFAADQSLAE